MSNEFRGLLAEHGLQTQEQLLRRRTAEAMQRVLIGTTQQPYNAPSERTAHRIGGMLGAALGARLVGPTPEQRVKNQIIEEARQEFAAYERTTERGGGMITGQVTDPETGELVTSRMGRGRTFTFEGEDPNQLGEEERLFEFERQLANAALKNGRPDLAAQIEQRRRQKMIAFAKAEVARAELESPNGLDQAAKLSTLANKVVSQSERSKFWNRLRAVSGQAEVMNVLASQIEDAITAGRDPGAFMGTSGRVAQGATDLANAVNGMVDLVGGWTGLWSKDKKEQTVGSIGEAVDRYSRFIEVPPAIRDNAVQANQYRALMVQLAYAKAKSNDATGRLSDADFENALKQIGANSGDPRSLASILKNDLRGSASALRADVELFEGIGTQAGLPPGYMTGQLTGGRLDEILEPVDSTIGRFNEMVTTVEQFETQRQREREAQEAEAARAAERRRMLGTPQAPTAPPQPAQIPEAQQQVVDDTAAELKRLREVFGLGDN